MLTLCLLSMSLIGQPESPQTAKQAPSEAWKRAVEIKAEAKPTDAKSVQTVSVRMTIKPNFYVFARPQSEEFLKDAEIDLAIKTKNPKTRATITYPNGFEEGFRDLRWTKYQGEITIHAVVQRAEGDNTPLECTLRFRPMNNAY